MKIEKYKRPEKPRARTITSQLRQLKPGEAIRVKTASDWRSCAGAMHSVGRQRQIKFSSIEDGPDVLIFIKSSQGEDLK